MLLRRFKVRYLTIILSIATCLMLYNVATTFINQDDPFLSHHKRRLQDEKSGEKVEAPKVVGGRDRRENSLKGNRSSSIDSEVPYQPQLQLLPINKVEKEDKTGIKGEPVLPHPPPPQEDNHVIKNKVPAKVAEVKVLNKPGKDLIETATLPAKWNASKELLERLAARRQHVREVCHREGLDTPHEGYQKNAWEFLINKKHHLIWCNVFKAASSTWMWNFNLLAGYTDKQLLASEKAPVELARARYSRPSVNELEVAMNSSPPSLTFMITRHPLLRIVSAYRNKILTGNMIYKPLFPKIYDRYKQYGPPVPRVAKNGKFLGIKGTTSPSFSQFVQYVLDEEKSKKILDMHWIPQARFCTACLIDFDVFAKTETLDEDGNYIIFTSGINEYIQPMTINRSADGATETAAKELLCQLTKGQFQGLLELYKYDLELFQYDSAPYHNCSSFSR